MRVLSTASLSVELLSYRRKIGLFIKVSNRSRLSRMQPKNNTRCSPFTLGIQYPGYQRFFSRAGELLAEGAGHYKDLTQTGNRARKVSGTQGRYQVVNLMKQAF